MTLISPLLLWKQNVRENIHREVLGGVAGATLIVPLMMPLNIMGSVWALAHGWCSSRYTLLSSLSYSTEITINILTPSPRVLSEQSFLPNLFKCFVLEGWSIWQKSSKSEWLWFSILIKLTFIKFKLPMLLSSCCPVFSVRFCCWIGEIWWFKMRLQCTI